MQALQVTMHSALIVLSVFLASLVEGVEALTIVLAMGTTRGWRSTWYGVGAALLVLAVFIAVLGPGLRLVPLTVLRLVVGGLLLTFGLQWLRKAILRASGFKPLHDEAAIFKKAAAEARKVKDVRSSGLVDDWYSFTVAFKGVLLEGLEVAFIVITFGANQGSIPLAVLGAAVAVIIVIIAGMKLHQPLARVPENMLKFVVGVMLTSFGIFWGAEGAGIHWPGSDAALLGVIILIAGMSLLQVTVLGRRHTNLGLKTI
jgi:uncharacterized membrane protein